MPTLEMETEIDARPETCFALLRDPRLHPNTAVGHEGEFGLGQIVRFESPFMGIRTVLELEVTEYEPPTLLTDELLDGIFREFRHRHEFHPARNGTQMIDTVSWTLPYGLIGSIFNGVVTARLTSVISARNARLKALAESD